MPDKNNDDLVVLVARSRSAITFIVAAQGVVILVLRGRRFPGARGGCPRHRSSCCVSQPPTTSRSAAKRNPPVAPVETKTAAAVFTGLLTWILVTDIPAFHGGLPPDLAAVLPVLAGAVGGWLAPHTPRTTARATTEGLTALLEAHAETVATR
jgi:hypothetical protein